MTRIILWMCVAFLFIQCGNPKVKVDDGSETDVETATTPIKQLKTGKEAKTFRLEKRNPPAQGEKTIVKKQEAISKKQPNMTGYFRYAADAALFYPCGQEKGMPVAMDGDYLKTEKAYLRIEKLEFAEKVYVNIIGEKTMAIGMDDKRREYLLIKEFLGFERGKKCN